MKPRVWKTRRGALNALVKMGIEVPTMVMKRAYDLAPYGVPLVVLYGNAIGKLWYDPVDRTWIAGRDETFMT